MKLHRNIHDAILRCLDDIFLANKYADKVIERTLKSNPRWGARDRRTIAETTYDMVRWYRLLREICAGDPNDHNNLLNAYLDQHSETPSPALLKKLEEAKQVRKVRESIPDWLDELGEKELGAEKWERELRALNSEATVVLRANTLKTTAKQLQEKLHAEGTDTILLEGFPDALALTKRKNIFTTPLFKEGMFEVQDASSQLVAPFLQAKNRMKVIDACAGAGGKTLHIAALMQSTGKVIALDNVDWKLEELRKRARRAGCSNVEAHLLASEASVKRFENTADRLLLDVPCSGLGVLRRNPDAKWKLSADFIDKTKALQQKILSDYPAMLKTGGTFVYSTCSILPSENEEQIKTFLNEHQGKYELMEQKTILPSEGHDGFFMARILKK